MRHWLQLLLVHHHLITLTAIHGADLAMRTESIHLLLLIRVITVHLLTLKRTLLYQLQRMLIIVLNRKHDVVP